MTEFRVIPAGKVLAEQVRPGDMILTPALRTETVTGVATGEYRTALATVIGAKTYAWHFERWTELPTLRTSACSGTVKVVMRDDGRLGITAFVSTNPRAFPPEHPLVGAGFEGRGTGWSVNDAASGTKVETLASGLDRRAAASKVRAAAKAHARRLGLAFEEVR